MAIQKAIIQQKDLEALYPLDNLDAQYLFRFRVVSENKSRVSEWSPIFAVAPGKSIYEYAPSNSIKVSVIANNDGTPPDNSENSMTLSWTKPDGINSTTFDIYANWTTGDGEQGYVYASTTSSTSALIKNIPGATYVKFWVQAETFPKVISSKAKLFESSNTSTTYVPPAITGITMDGGAL
jgi:hypothetical protein